MKKSTNYMGDNKRRTEVIQQLKKLKAEESYILTRSVKPENKLSQVKPQ